MAAGLGYDEQGSLSNYFLLTFLTLALIPTTFYTFKPSGASGTPSPSLPLPIPRRSIFFHPPAKTKKANDHSLPVSPSRQKVLREQIFGKSKSKRKGISKK